MPDPATDAGNAAGRPPAPKPSAAVLRRPPGKARLREDALREYQDFNAKRRSRIPAPLWPFWAPDPDVYYRWRVQLDCNCITEVLTSGLDNSPDSANWPDLVHGVWLPMGQILCVHEDPPPAPYQEIVEWGSRRELTFPADPAEPPDWASAEMWAVMRHDEARTCAFWTVTLACGHVTEVAVSNLGWKPDDGPDRVSNERLREMTAEWEQLWAEQPDAQDSRERGHTQRMLADGWPIPAPEDLCYTCPRARVIVAYQRIGWLVPRPPEPKPARPPSRASLQRQLQQAEAQADELRRKLAQLDKTREATE
jgi:hypothetical protein